MLLDTTIYESAPNPYKILVEKDSYRSSVLKIVFPEKMAIKSTEWNGREHYVQGQKYSTYGLLVAPSPKMSLGLIRSTIGHPNIFAIFHFPIQC